MNVDDYDYHLPEELIAAHPAPRREESRLLVLPPGDTAPAIHRRFDHLLEFLRPGDLLVVNDSKVLPARLHGHRATGGTVELLLLAPEKGGHAGENPVWSALVRPGKKIRVGEVIFLGEGNMLRAEVGEALGEGARRVRFLCDGAEFRPLIEKIGQLPIPPYILKRRQMEAGGAPVYSAEDDERYQTVYAREEGSVAAPTAGLHFSTGLLEQVARHGVETARVTLHVGAGTFQTMQPGGAVENHVMHEEECEVSPETADAVNRARREGRRVIAVGTTSVRTLESFATAEGVLEPGRRATRLLIVPGYRFRIIDALITNFHLPRSTLLLLVSALVGRERLLGAYQEAILEKYRFYSYGDAMFLTARPEAKEQSRPDSGGITK